MYQWNVFIIRVMARKKVSVAAAFKLSIDSMHILTCTKEDN